MELLLQQFEKVVMNGGFPIWVAMFLLIRMDQSIRELTKAVLVLIEREGNKTRER